MLTTHGIAKRREENTEADNFDAEDVENLRQGPCTADKAVVGLIRLTPAYLEDYSCVKTSKMETPHNIPIIWILPDE